MRRVFLDWTRPALQSAADYLVNRYTDRGCVDLSRAIVVVPGGRAGRRLGELLLGKTQESKTGYFPPMMTTVGALPEMLYPPRFPFASRLVQQLAWARALRETPAGSLKQLVQDPPRDPSDPRWVELAIILQKQHRELAGDGFDFRDVLRVGQTIPTFDEADRWNVLADIQQRYLSLLDKLEVWDRQTARLKALEFNECHTDRDVVLVATADLNRIMRRMLDEIADRVTSLVFAPADLDDRFDEHGCLKISAWQDVQLQLRDSDIQLAKNASAQADAVVESIDRLEGQFAADQITVGVPDESIIPHIENELRQAGLSPRWGPGQTLERTRPIRFLRSVVDYLNEQSFDNLAELLRNPDIGRWLRGKHQDPCDLLKKMDRFQREHLPTTADKFTARLDRNDTPNYAAKLIADLLAPLMDSDRPPSEWAPRITSVLKSLLGSTQVNLEDPVQRPTLVATDAIREALHELQTIPPELAEVVPSAAALLMVLDQTRSISAAQPPDPEGIELLGWLELPLDDAPAKVVTSFNEGFVPSSIDSDLFLPNTLRSKLGIDDSQRLYARDMYAVSAIAASTRRLRIVVAKFRGDGEPALPSRLLFAADDTTVLKRSLRFFADGEDESRIDVTSDKTNRFPARHAFVIPRPQKLERPVNRMKVTAFRSYLACPYRYYLQHELRLDESRDDYAELDPRSFGTLAHAVLEDFGSGPEKHSCDPLVIGEFLDQSLDDHVRRLYGRRVRPAVRVQIEQLRVRLRAFARQQATRREAGWSIHLTEKDTKDITTTFTSGGHQIELVGRIDRIDRNEQTGRFAILDYKTSESGTTPDKTHRKRGEWVDLQLPLYRHFLSALKLSEPVDLGYVILPSDPEKIGFVMADWTSDDLAEADSTARRVVDGVCNQRFWPPSRPAPAFSELFAAICQDNVFDRMDVAMSSADTRDLESQTVDFRTPSRETSI